MWSPSPAFRPSLERLTLSGGPTHHSGHIPATDHPQEYPEMEVYSDENHGYIPQIGQGFRDSALSSLLIQVAVDGKECIRKPYTHVIL